MALERRDPVPPGRYSVYVRAEEGPTFAGWVKAHPSTVHVVSSIDQKALASDSPVFATRWDGTIIENLVGSMVLFDIKAPTPWVGLGFPTIEKGPSGAPRTPGEWTEEVSEQYQPPPGSGVLDEVRGVVLLAGALALGGVLIHRAMR